MISLTSGMLCVNQILENGNVYVLQFRRAFTRFYHTARTDIKPRPNAES